MLIKTFTALFAALLILGGCAQSDTAQYSVAERGDPRFLEGMNTRADELYLNKEIPAGARDLRRIYIAPADLSYLQIVQPEGSPVDKEWRVNAPEESVLLETITHEFSTALSYESAFNVVDTRAEAEIVVHTTVVAIHPFETRAKVAAGARPSGSITISLALVDVVSGDVLVRSVDTRSSDDIWAFNQIDNESTAVAMIFRAWGNSMRRGILFLQGRATDPLATAIVVTPQK
jgi:hypothetical protein